MLQLQQVPDVNHSQVPPPPAKRQRPGTSKMRPSKTSTTPRYVIYVSVLLHSQILMFSLWKTRNLCALEWAVANPKGTAEEFSAYYDGLSEEAKEVGSLYIFMTNFSDFP